MLTDPRVQEVLKSLGWKVVPGPYEDDYVVTDTDGFLWRLPKKNLQELIDKIYKLGLDDGFVNPQG